MHRRVDLHRVFFCVPRYVFFCRLELVSERLACRMAPPQVRAALVSVISSKGMAIILGIWHYYQYLRREELEVDVAFAVLAVCPTPYLFDSTND